jgi:hypothetical protein
MGFLISCRLSFRQSLLVAEEAKPRPELQADLSCQLIAELRKELLRRLILRVGVDAEQFEPTLDGNLFGLLHQRASNTCATKGRIDRKAMHNDRRLMNVPADLCIIRLLIHRDRGNSCDRFVYFSDPELSEVNIASEDILIRIVLVPLEIPRSDHEGNDAAKKHHQRRKIFICCEPYSHDCLT